MVVEKEGQLELTYNKGVVIIDLKNAKESLMTLARLVEGLDKRVQSLENTRKD